MFQYAKFALMVLAAGASAAIAALADNQLSQPEAVNIVIAALGAAVVFTAPNVPGHLYVKWSLAAATAAATALATFIGVGGIAAVTPSEWVQVALAAIGALGVAFVPNSAPAPTVDRHGQLTR